VDKDFRKELKKLGNHLQNLSKQAGFTQERMAELIGIDSNYLSKIECGMRSPTLKTLMKFAKALKIPKKSLLDY
jgi:transcriptional regulator with XRE-family HTH domain